MPKHADTTGWPTHLHAGAVRFARTSRHYEDTIAFYRDLVGLPVVGEFTASFGEDGTIFGLPDTTVQLEIVRAHDDATVGTFDQLVLYLDNTAAVQHATVRLDATGLTPIEPHAYWAANGAVVYHDPDGRDVVFAPWVYGRDPDPVDVQTPDHVADEVRVGWYDGDREALRTLFAEAEDSAEQLRSYINDGRVLVARKGSDLVGHLQLVPAGDTGFELKNMAVAPHSRGAGIGRSLVQAALAAAAADGATTMTVATATADIGNLRFYQRCGFRFSKVERDAFTVGTGYREPMVIDGIALRDRIWLDQPLTREHKGAVEAVADTRDVRYGQQ